MYQTIKNLVKKHQSALRITTRQTQSAWDVRSCIVYRIVLQIYRIAYFCFSIAKKKLGMSCLQDSGGLSENLHWIGSSLKVQILWGDQIWKKSNDSWNYSKQKGLDLKSSCHLFLQLNEYM